MDKLSVRIRTAGSVGGRVNVPQVVREKDYNNLDNRPQINGHTLEGDKTFEELGLTPITSAELAAMWDN